MNLADVLIIVFVFIPTASLSLLGTLCLHTEYSLLRAQMVQKKTLKNWLDWDIDLDTDADTSILDYSKTDKV